MSRGQGDPGTPQPSDPKNEPLSPAPTVPGTVGGHRVNLKVGKPTDASQLMIIFQRNTVKKRKH